MTKKFIVNKAKSEIEDLIKGIELTEKNEVECAFMLSYNNKDHKIEFYSSFGHWAIVWQGINLFEIEVDEVTYYAGGLINLHSALNLTCDLETFAKFMVEMLPFDENKKSIDWENVDY